MPNARELFIKIFDDFIRDGNPVINFWYAPDGEMDWFTYIWGGDRSSPNVDFLNRILHYMSLEAQDAHEKIFQKLQTEGKEDIFFYPSENDPDHTWIYRLLLFLYHVLNAENSEQIHKAIEKNKLSLVKLLHAYESAVGNTYILTVDDITDRRALRKSHAQFLRNTAEFMFSLAPEACDYDSFFYYSFMYDSCAYHAVLLYACQRYDLSIPSPDRYFQDALGVRDSRMYYRATLDAYEFYLKKNDPQTAYDVLYSWLHREKCGEIPYDPDRHSKEDNWRKENPNLVSRVYAYMSLLCTTLSNLHDKDSDQRHIFRSEAITYAKYVLKDEPIKQFTPFAFRCCMASLLETGAYDDAARIAAELSEKQPKKVNYLLAQLSAKIGVLCQSDNGDLSIVNQFKGNDRLQALAELIRQLNQEFGDDDSAYEENQQIFDISRTFNSMKDGEYIAVLLLCIRHLSIQIKRELRYTGHLQTVYDPRIDAPVLKKPPVERKPYSIAYYTTLSNLQYLLEPVYAKDPDSKPIPIKDLKDPIDPAKAKNCLTMMHAHYMNDPSEGITLSEALSDCIDQNSSCKNLLFQRHTPSVFRERLLDQSFVFLKSFTNIVDQLNMWSMYASDRSGGSDSNGCCVCIAPETFEMMLYPLRLPLDNDRDQLQLYKVAYLRDNKIVNSGHEDLCAYFELLKKFVRELNDVLAQHPEPSGQLVNWVVPFLQEFLTPIIFLFKDASYRAEHELRLIVTRSRTKEDMERISKTPQNPPKLYVNPYHQVFVDQIILGPKVKEQDNWIPHLQFELAKMWEAWPGAKRVPSVRKSSINYRD